MTTNGEFSTLTAYGNDLVNNATYGLKSTGGCGAELLAAQSFTKANDFILSPNPVKDRLRISSPEKINKAAVFDWYGRQLQTYHHGFDALDVSSLAVGSYILRFETAGATFDKKFIRQ
jgi:hypothetical protein